MKFEERAKLYETCPEIKQAKELLIKGDEQAKTRYCQFQCSKYCLIASSDMVKEFGKYCCKACYNCAELQHSKKIIEALNRTQEVM